MYKRQDEYSDGDLSFALVVNLKEEYKCRVSVWKPIVMHQDVELNIVRELTKRTPKAIIQNVAKYCTKPVPKYTGHSLFSMKNGKQLNIHETNQYIKTYSEETQFEKIYEHCLEEVDVLNKDITSGTINYDKYSKGIKAINSKLRDSGVGIEVRLVSKNMVEELFHLAPYDLVSVTDPLFADTYYGGWNYGC